VNFGWRLQVGMENFLGPPVRGHFVTDDDAWRGDSDGSNVFFLQNMGARPVCRTGRDRSRNSSAGGLALGAKPGKTHSADTIYRSRADFAIRRRVSGTMVGSVALFNGLSRMAAQ